MLSAYALYSHIQHREKIIYSFNSDYKHTHMHTLTSSCDRFRLLCTICDRSMRSVCEFVLGLCINDIPGSVSS